MTVRRNLIINHQKVFERMARGETKWQLQRLEATSSLTVWVYGYVCIGKYCGATESIEQNCWC